MITLVWSSPLHVWTIKWIVDALRRRSFELSFSGQLTISQVLIDILTVKILL